MGFVNQFPYSDFHELNLDWLIKQTKESLNKINYLEDEFAKITVLTEDYIQGMIDQAIATENIYVANQLQLLHQAITGEYQSYVQNRIAQLTTYIDNQDTAYNTLAQGYAAQALTDAKSYTDSQVLTYTMMINPITGEYEDVRNVVDDIVSYFHTQDSLTAGEYDALDMTAGYYDGKQLNAYDYDFNGKTLLP